MCLVGRSVFSKGLCFCGLFYGMSGSVLSSGRCYMNVKLERVWKKAVMA
jgi:hypothetical protein